MTEWQSIWALLFLIPLCMIVFYNLVNKRKKRATFKFSYLKTFKEISGSIRSYFVGLPNILKVIALILAIVALARPQRSDTKIKRNVEGIDIMIALDISDSMLIEDMKPVNRLEASKKTIKEFIEKRVSDKIGLIVFSGESFTKVPLTLDYPLLLKSLSEVTTTRSIKMGTAIGVALANSAGRLKESVAKSQVVVFLTDGENNSGTIDPETALEIAKGYGIKIYAIGMGKDGQAQIPITYTDMRGKKRKRYRPIHSKINEELLEEMAGSTGGKYYRAITTGGLENVFNDINKLEKTKIEMNHFTKYEELFQKYLYWALLLYVLSIFLISLY